jgi:mono/diheme cytochrome c family protein
MRFRRRHSEGTSCDVSRRRGTTSARGGVPVWGFLLGLGIAGCAGRQTPPDRISSPGEALFNGRVKADVTCYRCHNGDGTGTLRGPSLARRIPKLTDEEIVAAIEEGPGFMPSFKGKMDDAELKALTAWLRGRFPKTNEAEVPSYP